MSFLIFIYIAFLVVVTLANYKRKWTVAGTIIFLFGFTSLIFFKGLLVFETSSFWFVFGKDLTEGVFQILIGSWFLVDLISSILIIRSYREYVRING